MFRDYFRDGSSARALGRFWLLCTLASGMLYGIGRLGQPVPRNYFFLLPYDGTLSSVWTSAWIIVAAVFTQRPWDVMAFMFVPLLAVTGSALWLVRRLLR